MVTKRWKLFSFSSDVLFQLATGVTVVAVVIVSFFSRTTVFSLELRSYVILAVSFLAVGGCLFAAVYQVKVTLGRKGEEEQLSLPVVVEDVECVDDAEEEIARLEEYGRLLGERVRTARDLMEEGEKCRVADNAVGVVNDMLESEVKQAVSDVRREVKRANLVLGIVERVAEDKQSANRSLFLNGTSS